MSGHIPDGAGGWSVISPRAASPGGMSANAMGFCDVGQSLISGYTGNPLLGVTVRASGPMGCVFDSVDTTNAAAGTYVWRYGVLLAADAKAHQHVPTLPMAPAAEIAEAMSDVHG